MSNFSPLPPFDVLVAFHREDPQGYDTYRAMQLNRAIVTAPTEHREALIRTLQNIEATRKSATSTLEAATLAHSLMSHSLDTLAGKVKDLQAAGARVQTILVLDDLMTKSHTGLL